MKSMKAKLSRLIFRHSNPNLGKAKETPAVSPEMTLEDFNSTFPGDLETLYQQPILSTQRRHIRRGGIERNIAIGTNGTGFLDLPREVRNEIYYHAVVSHNKVWNISKPRGSKQPGHNNSRRNILERLPQLCRAIPLYTEEVLETHYKHNILRFGSYYGDGPSNLFKWIHQRGIDLVKNVRHMRLVHRFDLSGYRLYGGYVVTTINQLPNCTLEVTCNQFRAETDCHCGVAELVQERLLREDAQSDTSCVRRIEDSTEYGPVLGLALQLLEAVQLARNHEATFQDRTHAERREIYRKLPSSCILCGKPKWALRY